MSIHCGCGQANRDPSLVDTVFVAGFDHDCCAETVRDDLNARVFAIGNDGRLLVLLGCVLNSFYRGQCEDIRLRIADRLPKLGLAYRALLLEAGCP